MENKKPKFSKRHQSAYIQNRIHSLNLNFLSSREIEDIAIKKQDTEFKFIRTKTPVQQKPAVRVV